MVKHEMPYDEACNLEPWRGIDEAAIFGRRVTHVTYGEGVIRASHVPLVEFHRRLTVWQRLRLRLGFWRAELRDLWWEARYRVRTATALLRDAARVLFCG